jgi:hypothetical protein
MAWRVLLLFSFGGHLAVAFSRRRGIICVDRKKDFA